MNVQKFRQAGSRFKCGLCDVITDVRVKNYRTKKTVKTVIKARFVGQPKGITAVADFFTKRGYTCLANDRLTQLVVQKDSE